jgi:hypothetical protein
VCLPRPPRRRGQHLRPRASSTRSGMHRRHQRAHALGGCHIRRKETPGSGWTPRPIHVTPDGLRLGHDQSAAKPSDTVVSHVDVGRLEIASAAPRSRPTTHCRAPSTPPNGADSDAHNHSHALQPSRNRCRTKASCCRNRRCLALTFC